MADAILNEWFLRLVPRSASTDTATKSYSLKQLLAIHVPKETEIGSDASDESTTEIQSRKPRRLTEGGIVLGRKAQGSDGDKFTGEFSSPIISRSHAQLHITPNGHVYLTDLGSLHGTQVRPSASVSSFQSALRPTSVRLKAYSPVQLCSGDTLQLGKSVQFGRDDFPPVEVRAHFRYPELGNGSSSGKRTFIGVTSPDFANGKFASNADVERLIAGVRATGTWRTEQNDGMKSIAPEEEADSECEHREEEIQGTQSRWERRLVNADQLNVDNQSPTASNGGKSDDDEHTPRGGPERDDSPPFDLDALPPVRESTMRPSGYRVPPSVLYQSDDEESELPRGSENRQDAEDEEDQETDGEGPERLRLRPRPPINIAEPLVQLARRNDSTECRLAHRNLVPTADGTGAIYRLVPHTRGGSASDLWADPFDAIFDDEADLEPVQWSHQLPLSPGPKESSSKGHEEGDKNEVADPIHPPIAFYGANLERTEYNEDNEPHRDPAYGRWYSYTSEPDEEAIAFEGQIPLDPAHANDRDGEQDEDRIKSEETCHGQDGLPSLPPIWAPLLSEARTEDYEVKEEDVQDVADEGRTAVNTDKHVTPAHIATDDTASGMNLVSSIARSEGRLKVNHLSQLLQAQEASIKDYLKFSASQPSSQDVGNPAQQPPPYVIEEGVDSPELHQADADDEEEREVMSYSSDIDEQSDAIQDEHEDYDEKDENEGVGESEDSEENEEIDDEEDVDEHDEEHDEEEELDYGEGDREGLEGEEEDSNEELTEEEEDFHDDEEDQDEAVEIPACVVFGGAPSDLLVHLLVSPPPKQDQVAVVMEDAGTSSTASVLPDAQTIQQGEHDRSPPCLPLMATKASDAVEAEYTTSAMNAEPRSMVVDGVKESQLPCNVIAADHGSSEEQPSATDVVEFATENAPPMPETPSRCQLAENPVYGRTPSISDASSEGPVTPPTTSHKRHLRADFDVEVHGNQPVNAATRPRKVRKLTSTLGLIALGAALGSVGTIAGLMQVPL